ncbi:hypothetical protein LJ737_13130 [Hymenobacter sp. 15J16-1T3B]|uniref:hypothetical protein n=1 Tax=Hymenobacter sp. 15J16-1T3B TaxID=2886941 RepID=UPI001D10D289|nr:hypothetical protein [Hymenobacter sp. 15J16-1T3B]MCC3158185.1 hypothetical protein [Hymenobacter sp. 15J16-1T3B]
MAHLSSVAPPPVVLGVALTIARHQRPRPLASTIRTRSVKLRIDPSLEQIYLIEATLPGNLECLGPLTQPNVTALYLRAARLELLPVLRPDGRPQHGPSLAALATGNCFISTQSHKTLLAGFGEDDIRPDRIDMVVQGRVNLLDYLRTDWFTLELSGTHRRRFSRPLPLRLQLEFETQTGAVA